MLRKFASASMVLTAQGSPLVRWQLMSGIAYDGLHSQAALSKRVLLDPAQTSRALAALEAAGLVRRDRDGDDRRCVSIHLTAAGRRWYEKTRREIMGELAPLFAPLNRSELKALERLLLKLTPAPHA